MRDMVALSALSALWDTAEPDRLAEQLGDAIIRVLGLNGAFVHFGGSEIGEAYRRNNWDPRVPVPDAAALATYIDTFADPPAQIESPGAAPLRLAVSPVGDHGGVVALSHRSDFPNEIDRMLLGVAANQAAIALDRARLLGQREEAAATLTRQSEALQTINSVGQTLMRALDLEIVVQTLTDAATRLTGAQFGAFFYNVLDERGESYQLYTLSGASLKEFEQFPLPRNTAIFAPTFRGEGVVRLADVRADPRFGQNPPYHGMPKGHLPVRSYLAMPVVDRSGEVLGGLFLGHEKVGVFLESHEELLAGLATQASIAISNAKLYQEAQQAIRARDQFLSIASHELRTPVTVIKSTAQLIQRRLGENGIPTEALSARLTDIDRESNKLSKLMDSLLDVARLQHGLMQLERKRTDLSELVQGVVDEQQRLAGGHAFALEIHETSLTAYLDPLRIEQVLQNLLSNAVKYSPDGSRIEVDLRRDGAFAIVQVRDYGVGIADGMGDQLFRPFSRAQIATTMNVPGLGLGLYISREIIEAHGGRLGISSDGEGLGATATFTLPLGE